MVIAAGFLFDRAVVLPLGKECQGSMTSRLSMPTAVWAKYLPLSSNPAWIRLRLRGGRKRAAEQLEEAEKPPQKKRSARRKRESTDDADPNARSRFADLLAASEEAVRDNVDEDSSAESVVTCPACNQVHNHTEQHEHASDSSVSSESEMASNSLLSGHALDPRTQDYFQSLRKDSEIEPEAYDLLFRKCVERESLDKALALYEDLRNHSLTPTFDSLDAMLDLCHQTERWDVGLAVLHDVKARGITLNENIYSKVLPRPPCASESAQPHLGSRCAGDERLLEDGGVGRGHRALR